MSEKDKGIDFGEPEVRPILRARTQRAVEKELSRIAKTVEEDSKVDPTIPGSKLDRFLLTARKVPWTLKKFAEIYGEDEYVPEVTVPVTLNGVTVLFEAGKEKRAPKNFIGAYLDWRKRQRRVVLPTEPREGVITISPGAGPLRPYADEE